MNIGKEIERLRKEHGLSRQMLAKRSGVSYTSVYWTETGDHAPNWTTAELLLRTLGHRLTIEPIEEDEK